MRPVPMSRLASWLKGPQGSPAARRPDRRGQAAPAVVGVAPDGSPATLETGEGHHLLVFVTSSCRSCLSVWETDRGDDAVLVTPGPNTENRRAVGRLAAGRPVVMSSDAWLYYAAGPAPWLVETDGGVVIRSEPVR